MSTTTRAAIRRRAVFLARANGRSRGMSTRDGSTALTATGGSATTLIDTAGLPPAGAASTMAKGAWIYRPAQAAADQRRIISSYDATTRTFTIQTGTNWATSPAASDPYLVLKDDPDLWDSALHEALRTILSTIKYDEFTPTASGQVLYNVASAPISLTGITRDSQILAVDRRDVNDASGQENWEPWNDGYRVYRSYMDEGVVYLDFRQSDRAPTTSDRLRIKWADQFDIPASESASIAVDELWAAWGTVVQMAKWLADPNNPDDDWNVIGRNAQREYATYRRLELGEDAWRRVTRTAQRQGIIRVGGRAGRGRM